VRSVDRSTTSRRVCAGLAAMGAVVTLAGCATTQDEAARLQLNSARIRTAEQKTVVRSAGSAVAVNAVSLLSSPGAHTFVVTVHNRQSSAVTDLPISVGVSSRGHRRVDLNAHSTQELSYNDSHLPRIAAGSSLTWVFTTTTKLPSGAHPFALVGARPSPAASAGATAPTIAARVTGTQRTRNGAVLEVTLRNGSTIPQYQMPIYAVAERGGRFVAAGELIVPHLGSQKTLSVRVPVRGLLSDARLNVAALPAIVH
jgi:hypothetical protein